MQKDKRYQLPMVTTIGFALAITAIVVVATLSYRALSSRARLASDVTATMAVLQELEALVATLKDAETGQRGYLLTGEDAYLTPYQEARARVPGALKQLRDLWVGEHHPRDSLVTVEQLIAEKMGEMERTVQLQRSGDLPGALALVRTDRGRVAMDELRTTLGEMQASERLLLEQRNRAWVESAQVSVVVSMAGSAVLLALVLLAALLARRDHRLREAAAWIRAGQAAFATRIQGEHRVEVLGRHVLDFVVDFLHAQVGALFVDQGNGRFVRVGLVGGDAQSVMEDRGPEGLVAQAISSRKTVLLREVPAGYLTVASSLGRGDPRQMLIAPAVIDGVVLAVLEVGFFQELDEADRAMLDEISETLAVAVRTARDRSRLEELLAETQRQGEELQTQQEELRVNNEELEEQGRVLKESQSRLETQQAELEQINSSLEEQTQLLEAQRDDLARTQKLLTAKADELERSNQYKSEFLANMSHELRTPLNSSLILSKLLADNKQGNLTEEQVKFASTITSAGNDLLTLINDILDLSKIEAGKMEVTPERVLLPRLIESMEKTFEPVARQRALAFHVAIEPGLPERIETDGQRLSQILRNLLSNALKFTPKGEVSLRVSAPDADSISFAVSDTGIGIAEEHLEVVFEAFRQADGSTHRRFGGSGLGLSISRDLAGLLGGSLGVSSRKGEGSVFTLTLPRTYAGPVPVQSAATRASAVSEPGAAPAEAPPPRQAGAVPAPIAVDDDRDRLVQGTRTILVIEDDASFAEILRDLAREQGYACVITHTANDGLLAASLYRPSAIVLDVNLPDYSGISVLEELKRNPQTRHIPVHMASIADYAHRALELGAVGYALKPVKRDELVDAFRKLEAKFSQGLRRVLVVEDDARQRDSIGQLLASDGVEILGVESASAALAQLRASTFDCIVMDLNLPDLSGFELLETMDAQDDVSFPPVIIYTGRELSRDEELRIRRFSKSIIVKDARSPERLLDEVTLFLHQVESTLPLERQRMLQAARDREASFEGRRILVVEDDVRNIFALSSVLEPRGAKIEVARNGREALDALAAVGAGRAPRIDLVLMDIMMPEMDGLTAMREIRKQGEWKKLPIIALTAKAMKDDHERCLAAGANDYVSKPLDVEKLLSLVRVWMPK